MAPGAPTHSGFTGLDLPPLNALYSGAFPPPFPNATSSYMRTGSAVPSRVASPMPGGPNQTGYVLPPPVGMPMPPNGYYPNHPGKMSPLNPRSHSPSGRGTFDAPVLPPPAGPSLNGGPPVPTLAQLEHHYRELADHRARLEEMINKTDIIMAGVKRGIDEMRHYSSPPAPTNGVVLPPLSSPPASMPLNRDRQVSREGSVWPHAPTPVSPAETRASSLSHR